MLCNINKNDVLFERKCDNYYAKSFIAILLTNISRNKIIRVLPIRKMIKKNCMK